MCGNGTMGYSVSFCNFIYYFMFYLILFFVLFLGPIYFSPPNGLFRILDLMGPGKSLSLHLISICP